MRPPPSNRPGPGRLDAPVLIAAPEFEPELAAELKHKYQASFAGLRGDVKMLIYVDAELWKRFMDAKEAKRKGAAK